MAEQSDQPTFADVLEKLRLDRGLSPAQLARELHEYEGNVSRWRRGMGIDRDKVRKIADYFGVDRPYLEQLAGYPDSSTSLTRDRVDAEREAWGAWYQHLIDEKVPRYAWGAYTRACEQLAELFGRHGSPVTPPPDGSVSTPADGSTLIDSSGPTGPLTSDQHPYQSRFPRHNRSTLSVATS